VLEGLNLTVPKWYSLQSGLQDNGFIYNYNAENYFINHRI